MSGIEKIAKILRTDKDYFIKIDSRLSNMTGRKNVFENLAQKNEEIISKTLSAIGVSPKSTAKEVYYALIEKIKSDTIKIDEVLGRPDYSSTEDCARVLAAITKMHNPGRGWFLKKEKAEEFILNVPPPNVMAYLGYKDARELLAKEDLFEIYSALRFVEDQSWMNEVFFKQYESLTPDDFEERDIILKAIDVKWRKAAERFVVKKWHNISHLKELGVVFVIPISLGIPGETLRTISLVFHYLNEVPFYSDMFRKIAEVPVTFSANLTSLLRGDVIDRRIPESEKTLWLVVQRYLAKDDENDWRLFVPRVNPEARHWLLAEESLIKLGNSFDHFGSTLGFWADLDWVGGYFKDEVGNDVLVSFDLVDTVMSLVKEKELIKYLYHHQEALWNRIFTEYFGRDQLDYFLKEYLLQGYFEV